MCRFIQYRSDVGMLLHLAPLALCVALPILPRRRMAWGTALASASTLGGILVPATVGAVRALISGGGWQSKVYFALRSGPWLPYKHRSWPQVSVWQQCRLHVTVQRGGLTLVSPGPPTSCCACTTRLHPNSARLSEPLTMKSHLVKTQRWTKTGLQASRWCGSQAAGLLPSSMAQQQ